MEITLLLAFGLGAIILLLFAHQLLFKPKNFPPGPMSVPFIGGIYALGTKPYNNFKKMRLKYGNVIGLDLAGFKGIILNSQDTIKKAFAAREFQNRPKYEILLAMRGHNSPGIVCSEGKTHEEQRSFLMKNLKVFGLNRKAMEILLIEQLDHFFSVLDTQLGKPIMNNELFNTIAMGALWTVLSNESAREDDEEFQTVLKLNKKIARSFKLGVCIFPKLSKLLPNISGWNGMLISNANMLGFVKKKIVTQESLINSSDNPKNFIQSYIQKIKSTTDANSSFFQEKGRGNLTNTINDLFGGGTETVSTTLTWFLSVIIRYPEKQKKIQKAIDNGMGTRTPALADRPLLPYVEAFVLELLRFSAVVPLGLGHSASEDVQFQNFVIPKDTVVIANLHHILHDPELWSEPDVFQPERFLSEDESTILRNIAKTVDLAFGYGKRLCPGETLAKDELFLIIAGLSQKYTFKPDPKCMYSSDIDCDLGVTLIPKPHTLIVSKR